MKFWHSIEEAVKDVCPLERGPDIAALRDYARYCDGRDLSGFRVSVIDTGGEDPRHLVNALCGDVPVTVADTPWQGESIAERSQVGMTYVCPLDWSKPEQSRLSLDVLAGTASVILFVYRVTSAGLAPQARTVLEGICSLFSDAEEGILLVARSDKSAEECTGPLQIEVQNTLLKVILVDAAGTPSPAVLAQIQLWLAERAKRRCKAMTYAQDTMQCIVGTAQAKKECCEKELHQLNADKKLFLANFMKLWKDIWKVHLSNAWKVVFANENAVEKYK